MYRTTRNCASDVALAGESACEKRTASAKDVIEETSGVGPLSSTAPQGIKSLKSQSIIDQTLSEHMPGQVLDNPETADISETLSEHMPGQVLDNPETADISKWIHCVGGRSFQTPRARWWYLVMSNCYSDVAMDFDYNITMTNGVKLWDKHFSADERYILETNLVFMVLYFFLSVITIRFSKILSERRFLHCTYKLFAFSVLAEFSSLFLMTIAYGMYGKTGLPYPGLEMLANFIESAGILVFILTIILLGKGFTITR
ncbi:transmembrane protein 145-like [Ptychodera flava]|uniref:transmembrane protein 145-like n=1 Tax=Ptychodera flava TaxID=63121 RepID=UPI00396A9C77